MRYKRAWQLVEARDSSFAMPLVATTNRRGLLPDLPLLAKKLGRPIAPWSNLALAPACASPSGCYPRSVKSMSTQ